MAFLRRLGRLVLVVFVVTFFTFYILDRIPGDPAERLAGVSATPEGIEELREELGLSGSLPERYGSWVGDIVRGDLGDSLIYDGISAWDRIRGALPKTLETLVLAELMAFGLAVPLAIRSAQRPGGLVDRWSSATAFGLLALPSFVLGIYLMFLFAVILGWFPVLSKDLPGFTDDPVGNLKGYFLPSLTLALNLLAVYVRLLRTDLIETLQQDYVMLAQARGLSTRRVMWRHVLRPSSLNTVTAAGLNVGGLIGGAFIVEVLFAYQGMGRVFIESIIGKDYFVVASMVTIIAVGYVMINFLVDILYSVLDPRIRRLSA
ncbi:MAG: ABC transporter permease [Acidimicrobiales bacterium]|jgi:peptide/nickel transport system permease protein|nr:ABC transporter permease [Acidimicrobiales bacterium]